MTARERENKKKKKMAQRQKKNTHTNFCFCYKQKKKSFMGEWSVIDQSIIRDESWDFSTRQHIWLYVISRFSVCVRVFVIVSSSSSSFRGEIYLLLMLNWCHFSGSCQCLVYEGSISLDSEFCALKCIPKFIIFSLRWLTFSALTQIKI